MYRPISSRLSIYSLWTVLTVVTISSGALQAASKAENQAKSQRMVQEALHREIYGAEADRTALLQEAAALDPNNDAAMWHQGFVKIHKKWTDADEIPREMKDSLKVTAYLKLRKEMEDTAQGHMAIADWCAQRGLDAQERAHLTKALDHNPDHADARNRLGFRRVNDQWMSNEEILAGQQQREMERTSLTEWRPQLEKLRDALNHRSEFKRNVAADRIRNISDVNAIPAMEVVLSTNSEAAASLVVDALRKMPGHRSAQSLVRHAVFSPSETIRDMAAMALKSRAKEQYIPALLTMMFTPIKSRTQIFRGQNGNMMYRHSFYREGQAEHQQLVMTTEYRRVARLNGDRRETVARAFNDAQENARQREAQLLRQNRLTEVTNGRIAQVLKTTSDNNVPTKPTEWWSWWNNENEVFVQGEKTTTTLAQNETVTLADRVTGPNDLDSSGSQRALDCLAAGTPVWTAMGRTSVEEVQVGDLVLAQNPDTGELAYKPVLQTTIRPEGQLVRVHVGTEYFETSGGHLFWVSGEGWVKARNLESGMELHSVNKTLRVDHVEDGGELKTYNLVVADFNTYFAGNSRILCHDNTIREPTDAVVPGLIEE